MTTLLAGCCVSSHKTLPTHPSYRTTGGRGIPTQSRLTASLALRRPPTPTFHFDEIGARCCCRARHCRRSLRYGPSTGPQRSVPLRDKIHDARPTRRLHVGRAHLLSTHGSSLGPHVHRWCQRRAPMRRIRARDHLVPVRPQGGRPDDPTLHQRMGLDGKIQTKSTQAYPMDGATGQLRVVRTPTASWRQSTIGRHDGNCRT